MLNDLEDLQRKITNPIGQKDASLLHAEAIVLLAKEIRKLNQQLQLVTAASDYLQGGYALRVVNIGK